MDLGIRVVCKKRLLPSIVNDVGEIPCLQLVFWLDSRLVHFELGAHGELFSWEYNGVGRVTLKWTFLTVPILGGATKSIPNSCLISMVEYMNESSAKMFLLGVKIKIHHSSASTPVLSPLKNDLISTLLSMIGYINETFAIIYVRVPD